MMLTKTFQDLQRAIDEEREYYTSRLVTLEKENDELKQQVSKIGHCRDCKYFELNSWAACGGIPIIVAHEICKAWGGGCKTKRDGYCFMFEPKEGKEDENDN